MYQPHVAVVTGATDGLGREVALRIAATGAHVVVHGRNRERAANLVARIEKDTAGSARFYRADFSSLSDVRQLAAAILSDYERLDLLINNAGLGATDRGRRELSADGHELLFAVNYLAGFLLTRELLPLLARSTPSQVVNVSSLGQQAIDFDDLMLEHDYSDMRAYCQSKLAQVMFSIDLARELEGTGVTVNSVHPATFMDTAMVAAAGFEPQSTVADGAAAVMHLVEAPDLGSGQFFDGTSPARADDQAYDEAARAKLRELSRALTLSA